MLNQNYANTNFCQGSIFAIRATQLNSSTSFLQSSRHFCEEKYLRLRTTILDLTGVQTLLAWALHAGIYSSTAVAHRVDGTLVMEARSVGDDLGKKMPPTCSGGHWRRQRSAGSFWNHFGAAKSDSSHTESAGYVADRTHLVLGTRFSGVGLDQPGAATSGKREGRLNPIPIFLIRLSVYRWSHSPPPGYIL